MGAPISLNNDGTVTQLGETLSVNSDRKFTNSLGSEFVPRQTEGNYLGVSAGFSAIGGFSVSAGFVKDAMGDTEAYFSLSGNIGVGAGIEAVAGTITPKKEINFLQAILEVGAHHIVQEFRHPMLILVGPMVEAQALMQLNTTLGNLGITEGDIQQGRVNLRRAAGLESELCLALRPLG